MSSSDIILLTVLSVLVPINLVGNSLVCLVVYCTKSLRTPINYLIVNLAIADMTVAVFIVPQYIFRPFLGHPEPQLGDYLCKMITGGSLSWIGCAAVVFTLVSIAFERYYTIMFPYNHNGRLTPRGAILGILVSWFAAIVSEIPPIVVMKYSLSNNICIEDWPDIRLARVYTVATFLTDFAVPFILMSVLYAKVLCKLWSRNLCRATHAALLRRRKKVTLLLFTVTTLHGAFLLPDTIAYFFSYFGFKHSSIAYGIGVAFICLNSTVNPFLYSLHSERFRRSLQKMLDCKSAKTRLSSKVKVQNTRELRSSIIKLKASAVSVD